MADLINTLINNKLPTESSMVRSSVENRVGILAKLASEMKLIEGLQVIRLTGSRPITSQNAPAQLLEASTANGRFSLINTGTPIDINQNKTAELALNLKQQTSHLILNTENNVKLAASLSANPVSDTQTKLAQTTLTARSTAPTNSAIASAPANQTVTQATNPTLSQTNNEMAKLAVHPQTQKNIIQQNVSLASEIKTFKVVGHGSSNQGNINNNYASSSATGGYPNSAGNHSTQTTAAQQNIAKATAALFVNTELPNSASQNTKSSEQSKNSPAVSNNVSPQHNQSNQATQNSQTQKSLPPISLNDKGANTNPSSSTELAKLITPNASLTKSNNDHIVPSNTYQVPKQANGNQAFMVTDGNNNFEVQSQKNLPIGSNLQVFIDAKGQFQVLPQTDLKQQPSVVNQALTQSLPQQFNDKEMSKALADLSNALQNNDTPPKVKAAISQLMQSFPTNSELKTAEAIKQSMQNSGAFLESNLLNPSADISKDVKLNWLKLHSEAQQTTQTNPNNNATSSEQVKIAHQALERITTNQLKNLVEQSKSDFQNSPIFIELPVRDKETTSLVQFQIERDSSQANDIEKEKRRWLAQLRFDFPETGKFEARVRVKENQAGIIFVAEERDTERTIRQNFSSLKEDLEKKDIELEQLDCFCRSLTEEKTAMPTNRLIDVRT